MRLTSIFLKFRFNFVVFLEHWDDYLGTNSGVKSISHSFINETSYDHSRPLTSGERTISDSPSTTQGTSENPIAIENSLEKPSDLIEPLHSLAPQEQEGTPGLLSSMERSVSSDKYFHWQRR